jgi:hypothetical protein
MNTRMKIMGLAALPLAGLLAVGGAVAQADGAPAGAPAGTQVVQQAVVHRAGDPCPEHAVKVTARPPGGQQQARDRDRDCGTCRDDHPARAAKAAVVTAAHPRHAGGCADRDDHGDR